MAESKMAIWAHRGLSMDYPENTLLAFKKAAELEGIAGIELDIQFTADKEIVVFHDETAGRVLAAEANIAECSLKELQSLSFKNSEAFTSEEQKLIYVPTLSEVLELMEPYCRDNGQRINIELKTANVRYEGIEKAAYELVKDKGMLDCVLWSSFLPESMAIIKKMDPGAETGMLAPHMSESLERGALVSADAYHVALELLYEVTAAEADSYKADGLIIRGWNVSEPLFGSGRILIDHDYRDYSVYGVTDLITNRADHYLAAGR
ncbi:glycerophosphodiester phosphodiesterase family protein [Butyrivibrio sp. MC2013]|uniref:glycerophosphodiester phosphodiesterase family protein n=1 Tax=Butyrivibrio sp. MC2013 TaxID=1280686 RepID=UPI0004102399|nr:glycerophosphodiester phosphodiesterase family protein [Butyrivibrio sp. MC2013]